MKTITTFPILLLVLLAPATHLLAQMNPDDLAFSEPNYLADFADLMHAQYFPETKPATQPAPTVGTTNAFVRHQKWSACQILETFHLMVSLAHKTNHLFTGCHDLSLHGADWRLPIGTRPALTYRTFIHH